MPALPTWVSVSSFQMEHALFTLPFLPGASPVYRAYLHWNLNGAKDGAGVQRSVLLRQVLLLGSSLMRTTLLDGSTDVGMKTWGLRHMVNMVGVTGRCDCI